MRYFHRVFILFVLSIIAGSIGIPRLGLSAARAQGTGYAAITTPNTSKFPIITTYLDVFDDNGQFITGLSAPDVTILENGQEIATGTLQKLTPPVSLVVAINSDPALALRDNNGFSRYEKVTGTLKSWAASLPADNKDQLALVWNGGVIDTQMNPAEWNARLDNFNPELRKSNASLSALAFALDAAQESGSGAGVKKSVLLVSPHLGIKDQNNLAALTSRAKTAGVRVFVWIVDAESFRGNPGTYALENLALETGAQFSFTAGNDTLPPLESWIGPLRNLYQVLYTSKIRTAGPQSLSVAVNASGQAFTSAPANFSLEIQPPSITLLSPPIQIVRQNPDDPFNFASFSPAAQQISVLVEFPDNLPRDIVRTTLFVDGEIAAENTGEPFTSFNWDLTGYAVSADHELQVEVEDALAFKQMSSVVPVQVTVVQPPGGVAGLILRNRAAVSITAMVLAGALVLGIILLGGRRGLTTLAERRRARAEKLDPLTQPVPGTHETPPAARTNPFPWLRKRSAPPLAYFVRLMPDGSPARGDPIPLSTAEITFGTDPTLSTHIFDHPSVSGLHARLNHDENEGFRLTDQHSTAGTWINLEPAPETGAVLKHGDVVNFGKLTYRFVLAKPPVPAKPVVSPLNPENG